MSNTTVAAVPARAGDFCAGALGMIAQTCAHLPKFTFRQRFLSACVRLPRVLAVARSGSSHG